MANGKKIVMGLSGGMDSSTLLALQLHLGYEVYACVFTYGSKHNKYENKAARDIVTHYQDRGYEVEEIDINLTRIMSNFQSALLLSGGEIPEGHYESESMKSTIVPGRNLIFASILSGLAESVGALEIALGVHSGDHHIYPDCRPDFIRQLNKTIHLSSDGLVQIVTPFSNIDKAGILIQGRNLGVPYKLTRTCYKDQQISCGKCGSCVERLEAFAELDFKDPIKYE